MSFVLLPGVALRGPLHPDADTAREWLRQELLRREYRPNLVQRMQEWFQELLDKAQGGTGNFGGLSDAVLLGLTVVVALLLVWVGLLVLCCVWWTPHPKRLVGVAAFAVLLWFVTLVGGAALLGWSA